MQNLQFYNDNYIAGVIICIQEKSKVKTAFHATMTISIFFFLKHLTLAWVLNFCFIFAQPRVYLRDNSAVSNTDQYQFLVSLQGQALILIHSQNGYRFRHTHHCYYYNSNILKRKHFKYTHMLAKLKIHSHNHYTNCSLKTKNEFHAFIDPKIGNENPLVQWSSCLVELQND